MPFAPLPDAANRNDFEAVRRLLTGGSCSQPDLDLALARACLRFAERRAIAELLLAHGAHPNGEYGGNYGPIIFAAGECLDHDGMAFLIAHGADVGFAPVVTKYGETSPLGQVLGTYTRGRNEAKHRCIELLLAHGAQIPAAVNAAMFAIHRGDTQTLAEELAHDATLVDRLFPDMPYGNLRLSGAGLLHLAVESGEIACVDVLLDHGADMNGRALVQNGIGGQTPIFHAIATNQSGGLAVLEHLATHVGIRVDLNIAATFRRHDEVFSMPMTAWDYATWGAAPERPEWDRSQPHELELLWNLMA